MEPFRRWVGRGYQHLVRHVARTRSCKTSSKYTTPDGYGLGTWIEKQRLKRAQLKADQIQRLEVLNGWRWDPRADQWTEMVEQLKRYVSEFGNSAVSSSYRTKDGFPLGKWVSSQRSRKNREILSAERIRQLEQLKGWRWDPRGSAWDDGYTHLLRYVRRNGSGLVPFSHKTKTGYRLGKWVDVQRRSKDTLAFERKEKLERVGGWVWNVLDAGWESGFRRLESYVAEYGQCAGGTTLSNTGWLLARQLGGKPAKQEEPAVTRTASAPRQPRRVGLAFEGSALGGRA